MPKLMPHKRGPDRSAECDSQRCDWERADMTKSEIRKGVRVLFRGPEEAVTPVLMPPATSSSASRERSFLASARTSGATLMTRPATWSGLPSTATGCLRGRCLRPGLRKRMVSCMMRERSQEAEARKLR